MHNLQTLSIASFTLSQSIYTSAASPFLLSSSDDNNNHTVTSAQDSFFGAPRDWRTYPQVATSDDECVAVNLSNLSSVSYMTEELVGPSVLRFIHYPPSAQAKFAVQVHIPL